MSSTNISRGRRAVVMKRFISSNTDESYERPQPLYHVPMMIEELETPSLVKEIKIEVESPEVSNPFKENKGTLDEIIDANGKLKFKKLFSSRKKASVRTREKRIRINRRLRKAIVPKNALMALHELKGVSVGDFIINNNPDGGFIVDVTINGIKYEGRGPSKPMAKLNACEKAMRDYMLEKILKKPRKMLPSDSNENLPTNSGDEPMDSNDSNIPDKSEDVPMVNLASFAIYKLFSEWENDGYIIPEMHPNLTGNVSDNESTTGTMKQPRKPIVRNELPANWESLHPASLMCFMRPGVNFIDKGSNGQPPRSVVHTLAINVDDEIFEGTGRSKKIARRNVASIACNALFNTNFDLEAPNAPI